MTVDPLRDTSPNDNGNQSGTHCCTTLAGAEISAQRHRTSRRKISPRSGRALESLGHAIEYLTDEYVLIAGRAGALESGDPRVEAIQVLMALNRQIYYACPEIEPAVRRFARWIFRVPAIPVTDTQSKRPFD